MRLPWALLALACLELPASQALLPDLLDEVQQDSAQASGHCLVPRPPTLDAFSPPVARFRCVESRQLCERVEVTDIVEGNGEGTTQEICQASCGKYGSLWPMPSGPTSLSPIWVALDTAKIRLSHSAAGGSFIMDAVFGIFRSRWARRFGAGCSPGEAGLEVQVALEGHQGTYHLLHEDFDESYSLSIDSAPDKVSVDIRARTPFGARHALETLSQLMVPNVHSGQVMVMGVASVRDAPKFPYRGVSLDTARHFYPEAVLKKVIDGLSYNKLNALHLHLTDSQSFPVEVNKQPNLTRYGAYGPGKTYSPALLNRLYSYAYYRGVRLVPEIDAPSHVAYGWEWGPAAGLGDLLLCKDRANTPDCFGPPCGLLNPLNPHVYKVLQDIYAQLLRNFYGSELFHIGGDEVYYYCWRNTTEIREWLKGKGLDPEEDQSVRTIWAEFEKLAIQSLHAAGQAEFGAKPRPIIWTSSLTDTKKSREMIGPEAEDMIVEYWGDSKSEGIPDLIAEGYDVIVANWDAWYLDCGGGWWVGEGNNWCSPYKDWRTAYNNRPYEGLKGNWSLDSAARKKILGGEACLWSETISPDNVEGRSKIIDFSVAKSWGVMVEPLQPEWCSEFEGNCMVPEELWDDLDIADRSSCDRRTEQRTTYGLQGAKEEEAI